MALRREACQLPVSSLHQPPILLGSFEINHAGLEGTGRQGADFAHQVVRDFLGERQAFIGQEDHEALIPYRACFGTLAYWSAAELRNLKAEIAEASVWIST